MLDVAELDARIAQIRHQIKALPEHQQLSDLQHRRADLDTKVRDARILLEDLTREQKKSDQDVEQVRTRRTRDQGRIAQGLITNPKDLERLNHELDSLERRINTLEDIELEIMERVEEAQASFNEYQEALTTTDEEIAVVVGARDEKTGVAQVELDQVTEQRATEVFSIPTDLLALYEKVREKQGVGAAMLRARRCEGCQLTLNPADLSRITKTPLDEVVRCEECSRILVRTDESGL
ncbi:zinc ribbon domain-containing protein [Nocardioides sp. Bht2]|uniref:zinc ribbon domain-containing protein n=1 Tax=Nocardioides sp. Bht2 TaxID=3392297 RepID=UPI0039B4927F